MLMHDDTPAYHLVSHPLQTKTPTSQLKFIMDAWHQIIECRRILSWTYCFGEGGGGGQ